MKNDPLAIATPLALALVVNVLLAGIVMAVLPAPGIPAMLALVALGSLIAILVYRAHLTRQLNLMEAGDLGGEWPENLAFGQLVKHIREKTAGRYVRVTHDISGTIEQSTLSLAAASHRVDQLRKNTNLATQQSEDIARAAETILANTRQSSDNTAKAAQFAVQTKENTSQGRVALQQAIDDLNLMSRRTQETSALVSNLTESSKNIQEITQVIDAIAKQINLLALNAAIEAARAGEQGRGFAVVADEVRKLAEKTSAATSQIGSMVTEISEETIATANTMDSLAGEVSHGVKSIGEVGAQLDGILEHTAALEEQVLTIAQGAENNHQQVDQISASIAAIHHELLDIESEMKGVSEQTMVLSDLSEGMYEALAELDLDTLHNRLFRVARNAADHIEQVFERAVRDRQINLDDLFDRQYQPIPGTSPAKYSTRFDKFTDRVLPDIQEKVLEADPAIVFAAAIDSKGYIPTHNLKFSKPLTGNPEVDMANNRTKRIFGDRTGLRCGSHTKKMLVQTYKRDTGEIMHDLSVPIMIQGKHWGGFRMGYKPT